MRLKAVALVLFMAALGVARWYGAGIAAAGDATSSSGGVSAEKTREIVLRRGDRGPVKRVQRRLRHDVDGAFGRSTERAVKRFQRRKGPEPDGKRRSCHLARAATAPLQPGERPPTPEGPASAGAAPDRQGESGGDPTAVSRDGRYRASTSSPARRGAPRRPR